jgi:peptide/nickel transport system substrate-binding protein
MSLSPQHRSVLALALMLVLGCASPASSPGPAAQPGGPQSAPSSSGPKRIVGAMQGNPVAGYRAMNVNNAERGNEEIAAALTVGLTTIKPDGELLPTLAEGVPSVDAGTWRANPDGTMQLTWKIRAGAQWHDGTPITSDDMVFTFRVANDPEVAIFRERWFAFVASVEAPDPQTVVVNWQQPYIKAANLFSNDAAPPLPRHILEQPFTEEKARFLQLPYWTVDYVGSGPYRLKEWEASRHVIVQANDRYVLGRPKIDEIEFRTVPDANAIVASLLSGAVDFTAGRSLSMDQAVQIRDRMPTAQLQTPLTSLMVLNPQFLGANPPIVTNLTFRKAVMHALNREEMAETINYGLVPMAHHFIYPTLAEAQQTETAIVKYDYNPTRAGQMLEGLGLTRGPDTFYRDQNGQPMRFEIRATSGEINPKTMAAAADYLQRAGLAVEQVVIPLQLVDDQEYRASFPAFIVNGGSAEDNLEAWHSSQSRLPENRYRGANRSRYMNPELDAAIIRYQTTIAVGPRLEAARDITRHVTENLPILPLFFDSWPAAASQRITNISAAQNGAQRLWNVTDWDLSSR